MSSILIPLFHTPKLLDSNSTLNPLNPVLFQQAGEHLAEGNKQICAPVIRRCPRGAKKCKCSAGRPAPPYMAAVTQVRDTCLSPVGNC